MSKEGLDSSLEGTLDSLYCIEAIHITRPLMFNTIIECFGPFCLCIQLWLVVYALTGIDAP